jgi:acyl carrier protein
VQAAAAPASPPAAPNAESPSAPASAAVATADLEQFLVNFVVEQTGYPPEVIELDADLEADLGIDSIKKAQMFGELQEYFDVTPTDNLTLDDFPTLRHIVNFLAKAPAKGAAPVAAAETVGSDAGVTAAVSGTAATTSTIDMLHVRGNPYELGFQQGAEKKTEIRRLLKRIADLTDGDWSELPIPPGARANPERFFSPNQLEELRGMADAVEVPLGNLAALNLAVLPDFAASAAQVALVTHAGTQTQVLHGLAGEISLPPALAEMLTPLVLVREPAQGWSCATVTFAGIIGSLVGINGNGLAASTGTLIDTTAAPNGSPASSTVRVEGLLQRTDTLERATDGLRNTHATRGWTACLSHQGQNRVAAAEHDGRSFAEFGGSQTVFAANHRVLNPDPASAPAASVERFNWLKSRLASAEQPHDAGGLLALLGEIPSHGALRLAVVVDAARGDLLIDCGSVRERIHVGALLPTAPAGDAIPEPASFASVTTPPVAPTSADLQDSTAIDPESARFVLRVVPTPWSSQPADFPVWKGTVAVQGENALADALVSRIASSGAHVVRLKETWSPAAAIAELEQVWANQPVLHLFLTTLRDEQSPDRSDPAGFDQIYDRQVMLPYFLCQRQMHLASDAKRLNDSTIVAAVDLGGDFGFSGNVASPESGFLTGLMKSLLLEYQIMREQKGFLAKAIDAPRSESPAEFAANICRELAHGSNDYESSFIGGRRYLQVALPVEAAIQPTSSIRPGGVWVLTGGARGITAECGLELAKRFGLKLHLIGTTPAGAIDPSWRDLDEKQTAALRGRVIIEARKNGQKPNEAWAPIERRSKSIGTCGLSQRQASTPRITPATSPTGPHSPRYWTTCDERMVQSRESCTERASNNRAGLRRRPSKPCGRPSALRRLAPTT